MNFPRPHSFVFEFLVPAAQQARFIIDRLTSLYAMAGQVGTFAREEARSSDLPGQAEGPADAYRHLVGVAEF